MMLSINNVVQSLKAQYPRIKFFNGCISKDEECVGVYARGNATPPKAIGTNSSYGILPVTMLVHWGENSTECESTANSIYEGLEKGIAEIGEVRVIHLDLLDSSPVNIGRDDSNKCEMTIRFNVYYER